MKYNIQYTIYEPSPIGEHTIKKMINTHDESEDLEQTKKKARQLFRQGDLFMIRIIDLATSEVVFYHDNLPIGSKTYRKSKIKI